MGSRLHDRAFHGRQHEYRETPAIHGVRKPRASRFQATVNGVHPAFEVGRELLADRRIGFVELQRQVADRTAVVTVARFQQLSIRPEQRPDAFQRVRHASPRGGQQHGLEPRPVSLQDGDEQILWSDVLTMPRLDRGGVLGEVPAPGEREGQEPLHLGHGDVGRNAGTLVLGHEGTITPRRKSLSRR